MKKLMWIMIGIGMMFLVSAGAILSNVNIKDLITPEQKTDFTDKYGGAEHEYLNCYGDDTQQTCDVKMGEDELDCYVQIITHQGLIDALGTNKVQACDMIKPALIETIQVQLNESHSYTEAEINSLFEIRIAEIVYAETKTKQITDDEYNLEGIKKDWNK